ncbi:MAG: FkbM family methyltransferase [Candidatus Paceibacterota bacterium]|jgi:FkbM family methyltransferase
MNWLKRSYIYLIGFYVSFLNRSDKVRDFLLWPLATRVLGRGFSTARFLKQGFWLKADMGDILSRYVIFFGPFKRDFWEPQTTAVLKQLVREREGDILLAGSHLGYFTVLAGLLASKLNKKIYAFEPVDYLYQLSAENIKLNKLNDSVVLAKAALAEKTGQAEIFIESIRSSLVPYTADHLAHGKKEFVPTIKIDDWRKDQPIKKIGVIFLDIEGYELFALRGAEEVLKKDKPTLVVEISQKILDQMPISEDDIINYLESLGYDLYVIDDNYDTAHIERGASVGPGGILKNLAEYKKQPMAGQYYNLVAVAKSNV